MIRTTTLVLAALSLTACGTRERSSTLVRDRGFAVAASRAVDRASLRLPAVATARRSFAPVEQAQAFRVSATPVSAPAADADRALRLEAGNRLLIRTGDLTLRVDSLDRALQRARDVAAAVGAVLSSSTSQTGDAEHRAATIELRVRSDQFDRAIEGLRRIGAVEAVHVESEDVGEEYVDVSARIANGRRLESRLLDLLSSRTGKLTDVLQVERELARVRSDNDALEGRRRYLQAHAEMSTLTVNLHEPVTIVGVAGPGVMRGAFEQSWQNFVWLLALLVQAVGVVVPLAVLALVVWSLARRFGFRRGAPASLISVARSAMVSGAD